MNRTQLRKYIKRSLQEQGLSYREFGAMTEKYVPNGIGRQSLTHWTTGKHLPNMLQLSMIYFKSDPQEWLFDFSKKIMESVIDIKTKEWEAKQ